MGQWDLRDTYFMIPEVQERMRRRSERVKREQDEQGLRVRARMRLADPSIVALPLLTDVIVELRSALSMIGQPFEWKMLTDYWVTGLRKSGWPVSRGGTRIKSPNGGWYTKPDHYSIDAPCLEDPPHRASVATVGKEGMTYKTDFGNDGRITLFMLGNAWLGYDEEKTTDPACAHEVNRHILTCSMCDDEIWNDLHQQGHDPQRQWHDEGGDLHGSRSPFAFVLAEFELQLEVAKARYLVAHFEDAEPDDLARAQVLLTRTPTPAKAITSGPPKPKWDEASTIAWLDKHGIPVTSSDAEAWRLSKEIEGHPPKNNAIELYQHVRRDAAAPPA
jgi:hypothetical protein